MTTSLVAADIGGTHARFALAEIGADGAISLDAPVKMPCADHGSLQMAWDAFGRHVGPLPRAAALAIAAPVRGDTIRMTNNPWIVRRKAIGEALGVDSHILINDFAAVAHAVGVATPAMLAHLAGPDIPLPESGTVSVIGPGTGLGVALLSRNNGTSQIISTEGGHTDFAPLDEIEDRMLARLRKQHDRVSVERIVSGPGFRTIMEVLADIDGVAMPKGDDKALWTLALSGESSLASAALRRFGMCLGSVAGDIALCHGPGPVVIAGGLGLRIGMRLKDLGFHDRFVAKGRYRAIMEDLPIKLVTHPEPGLYGAVSAYAQANPVAR
ncbi:glucokinase [Pacificimonas sp. WHA3]|uniref:Glucokinase n=1 Tax=Pacificimonas pallii TaxID=2827236 RepID=A0ABS6SCX0_9SPHN|nr:glucokinase [Pacificimonas pallii]MBV7256268.1 glucokinase [Pacificimonas pallii]